jgi:hypothetical protein
VRPAPTLTRRALLGAAVVTVAGCHHSSRRPAAATPPPDAAAIRTATIDELELVATYDKLIRNAPAAKRPALEVERAIHATHLAALHSVNPTGLNPTGLSSPTAGPVRSSTVAEGIPAALRKSIGQLQSLATAAIVGANAALLASIAASHQVSLG